MTEGAPKRPRWWRTYELEINVGLALIFLILFIIGSLLSIGILAGISFLLFIFFGIYSVYALVRRNG